MNLFPLGLASGSGGTPPTPLPFSYHCNLFVRLSDPMLQPCRHPPVGVLQLVWSVSSMKPTVVKFPSSKLPFVTSSFVQGSSTSLCVKHPDITISTLARAPTHNLLL